MIKALTSLSVLVLLLTVAGRAEADVLPTSRAAVTFNGPVFTTKQHGNLLYVGGQFTTAAPTVNLSRGFVDLSLGSATPRVRFPSISGSGVVHAIVDDGLGGWFVGGNFNEIEGQTRQFLAWFRADGTLDPSFAPGLSGPVHALARVGNTLYVGGGFTTIAANTRNRAAAFDIPSYSLLAWHPNANGDVHALAVVGTRVFLGGSFTQVSGTARVGLAAVDATSGAVSSVQANTNNGGSVYALHSAGSVLYIGGYFTTLAGSARSYLGAIDPSTGNATAFTANANGGVTTISAAGSRVYVGGPFTSIAGTGRNNLAALEAATGAITSWNPGATFDPSGLVSINRVLATPTAVYIGGTFVRVGGEPRANIAAVSPEGSGLPVLPWNPGLDAEVKALALGPNGVAAGGTFVRHGAKVRNGLAAIDLVTGTLQSLDARLSSASAIYISALDIAGDTLYIGGYFSSASGAGRNNVAAVHRLTGARLPWDPNADYTVNAIRAWGDRVYIGGQFVNVGGVARAGLAAVDPATGALHSWNPSLNAGAHVYTFELLDTTLYFGGSFTQVGAQGVQLLAALDVTTNTLRPFNANILGSRVRSLKIHGDALYVSGLFTSVGGQTRSNAAKVTRVSGTVMTFLPMANGEVFDVDEVNGVAYLGGTFNGVNGALRYGFAAVDTVNGLTTLPFNPTEGMTGNMYHVEALPGGLIAGGGFVGGTDYRDLFAFADARMAGMPGPPSAPVAQVVGGTLRMQWAASPLGGDPASYVIEAAVAPGGPAIASVGNGSASPSFAIDGVPPGAYYLRVRARNAAGLSTPSPEIGILVGNALCSAPPSSPGLSTFINGSSVLVGWSNPVGQASHYTVRAGTAEGLSNIGTFSVGAQPYIEAQAPPGAYFVRVIASSPCGASAPSADALLSVGGVAPPVPPNATSQVSGNTVTIAWPAVPGAAGYLIEAGTGPLLTNITTLETASTSIVAPGVPAGTYYLRVKAVGANGLRSTSRELVIIVP